MDINENQITLIEPAVKKNNTNKKKKKKTTIEYTRPKEVCDVILNILHQYHYGNQVKRIQQLLTLDGYDCGNITGNFNDKTVKAVKQYQEDHNLPITGEVDKETWTHLLTGK